MGYRLFRPYYATNSRNDPLVESREWQDLKGIGMGRVLIFNPCRMTGGTELVLFSLAKALQGRGHKIAFVDLAGGWCQGSGILSAGSFEGFERLDVLSFDWTLADYDFAIMSLKFEPLFRARIEADVPGWDRYTCWVLHPAEMYSNRFRLSWSLANRLPSAPAGFLRAFTRWRASWTGYSRRIAKLVRQGRCYAMDESTRLRLFELIREHLPKEVCRQEALDLRPVGVAETFLAVPESVGHHTENSSGINRRVVWVSRLEGFKVPPLLKLARDLAAGIADGSSESPWELHVVGDGVERPRIEAELSKLPLRSVFHGNIASADLIAFLCDGGYA